MFIIVQCRGRKKNGVLGVNQMPFISNPVVYLLFTWKKLILASMNLKPSGYYEGLYHEQAAEKMNISRPTFGRILNEARRKLAEVLVDGKALKIETKIENGG